MMIDRHSVTRSAGIIVAATILSRISGFLRETAIAYRFGASAEVDAFLIALVIPLMLFNFVNLGVQNTFIPVYAGIRDKKDAGSFLSGTFFMLLVILPAITAVTYFFIPSLVALLAPGFTGETLQLTVTLSYILIPGLIFMGLSGLLAGYHHSNNSFFIPSFVYVLQNIIIMVAAFLPWVVDIKGLSYGALIGISALFFGQLPGAARFKQKLKLPNFAHPGIRQMALLMPPIILGGAAQQLKTIIDRSFASLLPEGSVAALNYSSRLYQLPLGFIIAILTALFPTLVYLVNQGDTESFKRKLSQSFGFIFFISAPMVVGLIILRHPIVSLLFERGAFDAHATSRTAFSLMFFSVGLVTMGSYELFTRAFFAWKDTKTPLVVSLLTVALNILLNALLIKPLAHGGIALATSLSSGIGGIVLFVLIRRKIGLHFGRQIHYTTIMAAIASSAMGGYLSLAKNLPGLSGAGAGFAARSFQMAFLIFSGFLLYFLLCTLLKVKETREIFKILTPILKKTGKINIFSKK